MSLSSCASCVVGHTHIQMYKHTHIHIYIQNHIWNWIWCMWEHDACRAFLFELLESICRIPHLSARRWNTCVVCIICRRGMLLENKKSSFWADKFHLYVTPSTFSSIKCMCTIRLTCRRSVLDRIREFLFELMHFTCMILQLSAHRCNKCVLYVTWRWSILDRIREFLFELMHFTWRILRLWTKYIYIIRHLQMNYTRPNDRITIRAHKFHLNGFPSIHVEYTSSGDEVCYTWIKCLVYTSSATCAPCLLRV